jgi:hypothetical protein
MVTNNSIASLLEKETNAFRRGIIKKFFFGSSFKCSSFECIYSMNVGKTLLYKGKPWLFESAKTGALKVYIDGVSIGINDNGTVYFNGADSTEKVLEIEGFEAFCKDFSGIEHSDNLLEIRNKLNEVVIEWNNLSVEDL